MRAMENNYGIIPYPLWDEYQEEYITFIANGAPFVCVPKTVIYGGYDRLYDVVSAVLEAMAVEGYRSVTENFYELALKGAYTRDDVAAGMIDLIVSNSTKNFLYEYGWSLSNIGSIFSYLMSHKSTNFASRYEEISGAAEANLAELISNYRKYFS